MYESGTMDIRARREYSYRSFQRSLELRVGPEGYVHGWIKVGDLDGARQGVKSQARAALGHRADAEKAAKRAKSARTKSEALAHADRADKSAKKAEDAASNVYDAAMVLNHPKAKPNEHEDAMSLGDQAAHDADIARLNAREAREAAFAKKA